jgi:hypothetical protein
LSGCGIGFSSDGTLGVGAGVRAGLAVGPSIPVFNGRLSIGLVLGPAVGVGSGTGYSLQPLNRTSPIGLNPDTAAARDANFEKKMGGK